MKHFCAALLLVTAASTASADIIYDTITGATGWTTTGGLPRNRMADDFDTSAPPDGLVWELDQVETVLYIAAAGTWNVSCDVIFWGEWNGGGWGGAGTNVFQTQLNQSTFTLAPFTTTGVASQVVTFDYSAIDVQFPNVTSLGFEIQWYNNGVPTDSLASALRDVFPLVGSSVNLFYRDANANGIIETTDGRTITGWSNANIGLRLNATAVPEPASLLLLGLAGLLIRRR